MKIPIRGWSIDTRALLAAVIPAILVAIALAWYFTHSRIIDLDQGINDRGLAIARQLGPASEFGVFSGNTGLLKSLTDSAAREPDIAGVAVLDAKGKVLAGSGSLVHLAERMPAIPDNAQLLERDARGLLIVAPIKGVQLGRDELYAGGEAEPVAAPLGMVVVEVSYVRFESVRSLFIRNASLITLG
ncbi:MAG: hypothetical protein JNJ60_04665, partial [Rhodocyclaceae bacterium]|nr:hypothetical protein [Rhodocyclaceae bacterium]